MMLIKTKKNKKKNNKTRKKTTNIYVFAYGSLMNQNEMYITTQQKKTPIPTIVCCEAGLKRRFNFVTKSSINVVGLENNIKKNTPINGILYKVNKRNIEKLDKRENIYIKKTILLEHLHFLKQKIPLNSKIYTYFPKPNQLTIKKKKVFCKYYLDICLFGVGKFGINFQKMFFETTCKIPEKYSTYEKWKSFYNK